MPDSKLTGSAKVNLTTVEVKQSPGKSPKSPRKSPRKKKKKTGRNRSAMPGKRQMLEGALNTAKEDEEEEIPIELPVEAEPKPQKPQNPVQVIPAPYDGFRPKQPSAVPSDMDDVSERDDLFESPGKAADTTGILSPDRGFASTGATSGFKSPFKSPCESISEEKYRKEIFMNASSSLDDQMDAALNYSRPKDAIVQALMDEYAHLHDPIVERKDKWLRVGDSPTKRLICKCFLFIIARIQVGIPHGAARYA